MVAALILNLFSSVFLFVISHPCLKLQGSWILSQRAQKPSALYLDKNSCCIEAYF